MPQTKTNPPTPHDIDARQRVIEAARLEFMKDGFRGASIDRIAATAGVAKQTVYNHFPSKNALYAETIRAGIRVVVVKLDDANGDVRQCLVSYGHALRAKLLDSDGLAWFRTFIGDLPSMPELGRIVLREGPMETLKHLAVFLAAAMDRGELRRDDPVFAADMFNGMLLNSDRTACLFAADNDVLVDPTRVEKIVDCFLRAYRPD
jgi:TetR/AcrR family transcriptional regulator, mexJK operon transcriptional repressor